MVIMNLHLDNFLVFMSLIYVCLIQKKIVHSTIEGECLSGRECFRYKKIVILMGSLREFVKHPNRTFKR